MAEKRNMVAVYRSLSFAFGITQEEFASRLEDEGEIRIEQSWFPTEWPLIKTYRLFDEEEMATEFILESEEPEASGDPLKDRMWLEYMGQTFVLEITEENADQEDDETRLCGYAVPFYNFLRQVDPSLEQWKAVVLAVAAVASNPWEEVEDFYTDSILSPAWDADSEEIGEYESQIEHFCPEIEGDAEGYELDTFLGFHIAAATAEVEVGGDGAVDFEALDFDFDLYDSRAEYTGYFVAKATKKVPACQGPGISIAASSGKPIARPASRR